MAPVYCAAGSLPLTSGPLLTRGPTPAGQEGKGGQVLSLSRQGLTSPPNPSQRGEALWGVGGVPCQGRPVNTALAGGLSLFCIIYWGQVLA